MFLLAWWCIQSKWTVKEFRCFREKWKGRQSPGVEPSTHLSLEPPVLCHWTTCTTTGQPPTPTIPSMYCSGGTECLSRTPSSYSVCTVRTLLWVDRKILSIRKYPCWVVFLTLNSAFIRLLWLSGRALVAQARSVLGLTAGHCWPFHFPLFLPHNI